MEKLVKALIEFNEERDWDQFHSPENLAKSICIEGEALLERFQWNSDFEINSVGDIKGRRHYKNMVGENWPVVYVLNNENEA